MTNEAKELPEFTAKLLTEMAFAYSRWSKYVGEKEDESPAFRKAIKDTHKIRYFILTTLLLAGNLPPGESVGPDDVWPRVQKDPRLVRWCEGVILQYAEEITLVKDLLMQGQEKTTEDEKRLIRDQLLLAIMMMFQKREIDLYTLSGPEVEKMVEDLSGTITSNFKAFTDSAQTKENLEKYARKASQEADFDFPDKPGTYVHKEGNA